MSRILILSDDADIVEEMFEAEGIDYELDGRDRFIVDDGDLNDAIALLDNVDYEII